MNEGTKVDKVLSYLIGKLNPLLADIRTAESNRAANERYRQENEEARQNALVETIDENSTYKQYASAKAIFELFVKNIMSHVHSWLDEHPEATTTVQNGSLEEEKFTENLKLKTVKDYATPQMYGFKNDGTAEDADRLQDCIDNNNTIFFPPLEEGQYCIKKTITVGAGKTIFGDNKFKTVLRFENCDGFKIKKNTGRTVFKGLSVYGQYSKEFYDTAKESGFIDGRFKAFTFCGERNITNDFVIFDDIWVRYFGGQFFYANGSGHINNIIIQDSVFEYGGVNCIEFIHHGYAQVNNITVRSCNISGFDEGICITGNNITITGCTIQACGNGIRIDGTLGNMNTNSHIQGLNIISNYFEGITKSYIYINTYNNKDTGNSSFVRGLTIIGNYGIYHTNSSLIELDENDNYYPAVRINSTEKANYNYPSPLSGSMVASVFYVGNAFNVNNGKVLIDGGGLLNSDSVFYADGWLGNINANNKPYSVENMNNAKVISRFITKLDTLKLYEACIDGDSIINNTQVTLKPGSKLYYNLKKKNAVSLSVGVLASGDNSTSNSTLSLIAYLNDGTTRTLKAFSVVPSEEEQTINWDHLQLTRDTTITSENIESYDLIINAGNNTLKITNPIYKYID